MGLENDSSINEVQRQEIQQANNEQIEQNQIEHQRNSNELESNSTIDNEGERKQLKRKDAATELTEDESSQLDRDDSIESENQQEKTASDTEDVVPKQEKLDEWDTLETDTYGADEVLNNNEDIIDSLDCDDTIEDELERSEKSDSTEDLDEIGKQGNLKEDDSLNDLENASVLMYAYEFAESGKDPEDNVEACEFIKVDEQTENNAETDELAETDDNHDDNTKTDETTKIDNENFEATTEEYTEKIDNHYESEKPEVAEKVRNITAPYYKKAGELARSNEIGRVFTDHKEAHVEMVVDKSIEAGDAIKGAVEKGNLGNRAGEGRIAFSSDIDKKTLESAALSHDTGMSGDGYALTPVIGEDGEQLKDESGRKIYEKNADGNYVIHSESNSNFNEIRENHSLNSAIIVLENRDQYKEAGYTDEQVDKIAAECMAHSKSSSGVADLNSKEDWKHLL